MEKEEILYKELTKNLKRHIIYLMKELGVKTDDKGAENMLSNIGLYIMKKNKDVI